MRGSPETHSTPVSGEWWHHPEQEVGKSPAELPQGQNAGFLLRFLDRKSNRSRELWGLSSLHPMKSMA